MSVSIVPPLDFAQGGPPGSGGLAPQIIWPTMLLGECSYEQGDAHCFPDDDQYSERHELGIGGAMSPAFRSAVRQARERIWLMDDYLLASDKSAEQLRKMLFDTGATDIRLATADKGFARDSAVLLKGLEPDLQKRNPSGVPPRVHILLNLRKAQLRGLPDVHDRYAIIDDVLWHCGATIGGLHNCINAMSFGWSAHHTKAISFFKRLWKVLEDDDKRHH